MSISKYHFLINICMKQNYAYKIRLYPTKEQVTLIDKTIGCCRLLYNLMLAERKQAWEDNKENKEVVYGWKYKTEKQYRDEYSFMKEVDFSALSRTTRFLSKAYNNFFKSISGQRKGGKVGFPQFKKKKNGGRYTIQRVGTNVRYVNNQYIRLAKLGKVKYKDNRQSNDQIKSATISRTPTGKYYCSILFEREIEEQPKVELNNSSKIVGLDMSLSNFFVDSNGNSPIYTKRYRKAEKKLKRLQHILSRKKKDSNRAKKLRKSINRINEKIVNQRTDFTHKLSTQLVKDNDVIVIESLNLQAMSQCLKLGKSVMDLGYSQFINQLQYKCDWYGKHLIQEDKWFASSKICHNCGYKYQDLTLSERKWVCPNCGTSIDRDENAAINLKQLGVGYIHKCT